MPKVLVTAKEQIINNMDTIDSYLASVGTPECALAKSLIRRGKCFTYRIVNGEYHFYPSRFIGYVNNSIDSYNEDKGSGRDTNPAINKILRVKCEPNNALENEYFKYLNKLGLDECGYTRKYWEIDVK